MTAHFHTPRSGGGRTCRTCRKWDGIKCADMRHKHNDDPDKPCLLYRYKSQVAVAPTTTDGGLLRCPKCKAWKPLSDFTSLVDPAKHTSQCLRCRSAKNLSKSIKHDRTKEDDKWTR